MFHVVPGRSTRSVALTQKKLCDCPPMRRVAVPPVTVPNASTSSGKADGHFEGVITVLVSVPVVVSPVFHVTTKVPVPVACWPPPPEIEPWLHLEPVPTLPAAVLTLKVLQLTVIGFGAALAGDALRPTKEAVPALAAATLRMTAARRRREREGGIMTGPFMSAAGRPGFVFRSGQRHDRYRLTVAHGAWLWAKHCRGPEQLGRSLKPVYMLINEHTFRLYATPRPLKRQVNSS
jgi:hypothetical protein